MSGIKGSMNLSLLKNYELPDKAGITDKITIKIAKHKSLNLIKKMIIENVLALYKKNSISVPADDDFDTGIWFVSEYIYNRQLTGAFNNFKKNGFLYFDPAKFAHSILNSFTSKLAESLKIRGFSNSYIISDLNNILIEFSSSQVSNGIVVNIYKDKNDILMEVILLNKSFIGR